ncbi:MAG: CBS domain-containing protein [Pseudomonadota bacterium]
MKAGELCNRDVVTATRDMSMLEAARLMREHHVGCLVVVEEAAGHTRPTGILTDRDIVIEVIAKDVPTTSVMVGDVMTYTLLKVTEDENVFDVAQRMRCRGVRRVPVISNNGDLAGIIALDDLLGLLSQELSLLATITTRETEQEISKRSQPC